MVEHTSAPWCPGVKLWAGTPAGDRTDLSPPTWLVRKNSDNISDNLLCYFVLRKLIADFINGIQQNNHSVFNENHHWDEEWGFSECIYSCIAFNLFITLYQFLNSIHNLKCIVLFDQ